MHIIYLSVQEKRKNRLKMDRHILLLSLILTIATAENAFDEWKINEHGSSFKERVVTNLQNGVQTIIVPKHQTLTGMVIFNDFNNDVSIYKIKSEKRCYVMGITAEKKKAFMEFHEAIMNHTKEVANPRTTFTGLKYSDYVRMPENLLAKESVDFASPGGILALKVCGDFDIVVGISLPTTVDVNKFALEQLQKSMTNSTQYGLPIRDLYTCSDALKDYAMEEMQRCNGVINDFRALCKFRKSACVYIVSCPYAQRYHYWLCKGTHNFTNMLCCEYECTHPRTTPTSSK